MMLSKTSNSADEFRSLSPTFRSFVWCMCPHYAPISLYSQTKPELLACAAN